jgi:hypothetical protein
MSEVACLKAIVRTSSRGEENIMVREGWYRKKARKFVVLK